MPQIAKTLAATCAFLVCLAATNYAFAAPDLAAEMSLHLSRYMNAALHSTQGDADAARLLGASTGKFNTVLGVAIRGGQFGNCTYAPASQAAQAQLGNISQAWSYFQHANDTIQQNRLTMQNFAEAVKTINQNEPRLLELAEQSSVYVVVQGGSPMNVMNATAAGQLALVTERLDKSATRILLEPMINPEVAFLLGKDTNQIHDIVQALINGSSVLRTTAVKADARATLMAYDKLFESDIQAAREVILKNLQAELNVKVAINEVDKRSEPLYRQIQALAGSLYQGENCP